MFSRRRLSRQIASSPSLVVVCVHRNSNSNLELESWVQFSFQLQVRSQLGLEFCSVV